MRNLIEIFDRRFGHLHERSCRFVEMIPDGFLFTKPRELPRTYQMFSCGEYVLRSAAAVEQTFLGITRRLWDDPFEWTLPEELSTGAKVSEYLREVEQTRANGFEFFRSDADLSREMPAPERLKPIAGILLETVARAEHFQGRAFAVFQFYSDEKLPKLD
ncbi:MAG TPA: hypothetical protein VF692_05240 [Pyrinomonadaceae bacterium]|jgi:hypothetical protein